MVKYIILMLVLLNVNVFSYNIIDNVDVSKTINKITTKNKLVKVNINCNNNECSISDDSIDKIKLLAIAKLKSVKSWSRDFATGEAFKYIKTVRVSKTECVITFIICNSSDSKMYDNSFGIEILYKDK